MKTLKVFFALLAASFIFLANNSYAQELCEECLDNVPEDMKNYVYNMDYMDKDQPLGPAIMKDWKSPSKPPWTIGYASTYAGNTWRKGAMERLMEVVLPKWRALGLVDDILITQSNLDDSLQIQQMRQMIDGGEMDDKIIAVAENDMSFNHINDISELPEHWLKELRNFFEDYKKLENNPLVTPIGHIVDKATGVNLHSESGVVTPITAQGWDGLSNKK